MKLYSRVGLIIIAGCLTFFMACESNQLHKESHLMIFHQSGRISALEVPQLNKDLELIARGTALALPQNEAFKRFLFSEALKQFDGDFDVLFAKVRNVKVGSETVRNTIANSVAEYSGESPILMLDKIDQTFTKLPLLQFAIPINISGWTTSSHPLVAVLPIDFDEKTHPKVKAFDELGNEHWLDAKAPPNLPVVVVSMNERVILDKAGYSFRSNGKKVDFGPSINQYLPECEGYDICRAGSCDYNPCLCNPVTCGAGSSGPSSYCSEPYRRNDVYERLGQMYMTSSLLSDVEGWPAGAPEIDIRCFAGDKDTGWSSSKQIGEAKSQEPASRDAIRDKWWNLVNKPPLFLWNNSQVGDMVMFSFTEYDFQPWFVPKKIEAGLTFKVKILGTEVSASPLKATWEIGDLSEDVGEFLVDQTKCPPSQTLFGGGKCYSINKRGGLYFILESWN